MSLLNNPYKKYFKEDYRDIFLNIILKNENIASDALRSILAIITYGYDYSQLNIPIEEEKFLITLTKKTSKPLNKVVYRGLNTNYPINKLIQNNYIYVPRKNTSSWSYDRKEALKFGNTLLSTTLNKNTIYIDIYSMMNTFFYLKKSKLLPQSFNSLLSEKNLKKFNKEKEILIFNDVKVEILRKSVSII
jgi:hypothetical protein